MVNNCKNVFLDSSIFISTKLAFSDDSVLDALGKLAKQGEKHSIRTKSSKKK